MSSLGTGTPKFIKLTQGQCPLWINVDQIRSFWIKGNGSAILIDSDVTTVEESPITIMELING